MFDALDLRPKITGLHLSFRQSLTQNRGFRSTNQMQSGWAERPEHRPRLSGRDAAGRDEVQPVDSGNLLCSVSFKTCFKVVSAIGVEPPLWRTSEAKSSAAVTASVALSSDS